MELPCLRTKITRGAGSPAEALAMVFKAVKSAQEGARPRPVSPVGRFAGARSPAPIWASDGEGGHLVEAFDA